MFGPNTAGESIQMQRLRRMMADVSRIPVITPITAHFLFGFSSFSLFLPAISISEGSTQIDKGGQLCVLIGCTISLQVFFVWVRNKQYELTYNDTGLCRIHHTSFAGAAFLLRFRIAFRCSSFFISMSSSSLSRFPAPPRLFDDFRSCSFSISRTIASQRRWISYGVLVLKNQSN